MFLCECAVIAVLTAQSGANCRFCASCGRVSGIKYIPGAGRTAGFAFSEPVAGMPDCAGGTAGLRQVRVL